LTRKSLFVYTVLAKHYNVIFLIFSFGYKQKLTAAPPSLYSTLSLKGNATNSTTPIVTTTSNYLSSSVLTTTTPSSTYPPTVPTNPTITSTTTTTTTADSYTDDTSRAAELEPEITLTTQGPWEDSSVSTTEQQIFQESQTYGEQPINEHADEQSTNNERVDGLQPQYTTELPTLIQMHNQQQLDQQQYERLQENDQAQQEMQRRNNAYAFESLEKAFATSVPHKIRTTKDLEQSKDSAATATVGDQLPWSWAKDIMLQKPVLKKSSQEVV
jgi:hypothetical protein